MKCPVCRKHRLRHRENPLDWFDPKAADPTKRVKQTIKMECPKCGFLTFEILRSEDKK
jgi:endogenous inhibitor of DNA gyrase (YacG/DUF329 family)